MKNTNLSAHKIAIPSVSGLEYVKTSDIIRFEGYQKLSKIFLTNNRKIVSSYNIGEFRKLLNDYGFYSPHKSHFINIEHIKKYLKDGTIIMSDDSSVPISKRRKSEFINIMKFS